MTRGLYALAGESGGTVASRMLASGRCTGARRTAARDADSSTGVMRGDPAAHAEARLIAVALPLEAGVRAWGRYRCEACGAIFDGDVTTGRRRGK